MSGRAEAATLKSSGAPHKFRALLCGGACKNASSADAIAATKVLMCADSIKTYLSHVDSLVAAIPPMSRSHRLNLFNFISGIHIGDCNRGYGGGYLEFRLWLNRVASKAHSARSGLRILGAQRPQEESQGFQQAVFLISFHFWCTLVGPFLVG